jgi:hypothetical protein
MKKNIYLLLITIICCYHMPSFGMFDGLSKLIAKNVMSWRKPKVEAYQTPSGMVPLSDYHCLGLIYTKDHEAKNFEQQIKKGIRYFEFDISTGEKITGWFKKTTQQVLAVVGSNKRPLLEVIAELAAILQKSAYQKEVVIVKLNNATVDNLGAVTIDSKLQKLLLTPSDIKIIGNTKQLMLPTLSDLRTHNKRLIFLSENKDNVVFPGCFALHETQTQQIFKPDDNYALVRENLQAEMATTNNLNEAAVGSPSFPKVSRSFFSPHFNMYHYVGMDYTDKKIDDIQRELAYGVRGFILPVKKVNTQILIGNTDTTLKKALQIISVFAKQYNEVVVIHLKNSDAAGQQAINAITNDAIIQKVLFKPADRLTQAKESAAKDKILAAEAKTKEKKIWPRLTWNYEKEKLVQITWDAPESITNIWAYKTYYNADITQHSLTSIDTQAIAPKNGYDFEVTTRETTGTKPQEKPALFYSGVLKAEQGALSVVPVTAALALGFWIVTQKLTDLAFWSLPTYEELVFKTTRENILNLLHGKPLEHLGTREQIESGYGLLKLLAFFVVAQPLSMIQNGILRAKNTFTIVREELIPINYMINGFFINKPISEVIGEKLDGKKTIFDKVNYLNRYNYILIDKHAISWTLTLSHLIRKALAPQV